MGKWHILATQSSGDAVTWLCRHTELEEGVVPRQSACLARDILGQLDSQFSQIVAEEILGNLPWLA